MDDVTAAENREALEPIAWVDQYGDYLYRYALSRLRDGEAAEEVVQQTFLAGLQHTDQFAGKGSERGWLLGILKRKIVDFIRQRNRTSSLADEDGGDSSEAFFDRKGNWKPELRAALRRPLDSLEREEFWRILRGCLDALPTRQADVFVLREMDDLSTEEVCKDLEITASNLWVLMHRARLRLAMCLKSRWEQETC
ncbi:MAG: sigma-70 family RNA polymerase sigma factor [Candidatus Paceibacterota bacterium]